MPGFQVERRARNPAGPLAIRHERRRQAVEQLISLGVEDPPDPETLSRELEAAHEPGGPH